MKRVMRYGQMFLKRNYSTAPLNINRTMIADSASRLLEEFTASLQVESPRKIEINRDIAFNAVLYNTQLALDIEIKKFKQECEVIAVRKQMPVLIERLAHLITNLPKESAELKQSKSLLQTACIIYAENLMMTSNTRDEALPYLDRALKLDPNNEEAQEMKDTILILKGEAPDNVKLEYAP